MSIETATEVLNDDLGLKGISDEISQKYLMFP